MRARGSRRTWLLVRVAIYLTIVVVLFVVRGGDLLPALVARLFPSGETPSLVVSGAELAPALVPALLSDYREDYPDVEIVTRGGGTTHALEDLLHERAAAAFLYRPPDVTEQALFRAAHGDTVLAFPIALGAIVVARAGHATPMEPTPADLAAIAHGQPVGGVTHLYVADPNTGLWDVLAGALGVASDPLPGVVFFADEATVLAAAAADAAALGVVSEVGAARVPPELAIVPIRSDAAATAHPPSPDAVATGDYPLTHYLYVSCRGGGPGAATKLVTHLTSRRGQRQVERAGYLPARHIARPVVITREPLSSWVR